MVIYGDLMVIYGDLMVIYGDLMVIYGDLMVIYGDLMVIYGDLMVFHGDLIVIYGDLMVICGDLMVIYGDLMVIYGDLMVIYGDLMVIYGDLYNGNLWWFNVNLCAKSKPGRSIRIKNFCGEITAQSPLAGWPSLDSVSTGACRAWPHIFTRLGAFRSLHRHPRVQQRQGKLYTRHLRCLR